MADSTPARSGPDRMAPVEEPDDHAWWIPTLRDGASSPEAGSSPQLPDNSDRQLTNKAEQTHVSEPRRLNSHDALLGKVLQSALRRSD